MAKQQIWHIKDGYCTTTDAVTETAICTFDISTGASGGGALNNCTIFIEARTSGFNTTANTGGGESIAAAFKVVAGTLSQIGTTVHVTAMIEDMAGAPNTGFSISGNVITHWATGSAAATVGWFGRMFLTIYQPV